MWFGSVRVGKAYASFHLLPLYMNPALTKTIAPALKKRMQGKACFNFKDAPENDALAELKRLTEASFKEWASRSPVDRSQRPTLHGENSGHVFIASIAHAGVLSVWHVVHGFGTFAVSVVAGEMNLNVWLRTITSPSVCSIFGMWQPTHSLPGDPAL